MKKIAKQKNSGITLIALVITIIVLLILAGVTISTLTGENGILTRATEAKREDEIATVKEQAQLDITNWVAEKLKSGEDTTIDTPEKIQEILDAANSNNENKYYIGYTETGIKTPSGYEIPFEELYNTNASVETTKNIEDLNVGDRVNYIDKNGETISCIVLYDKTYNDENGTNYGVQIITEDVVEDTVTLGGNDFYAARDSYNNALKILYDKAQEYLNPTYATSARCVGSNPANPDWDTDTNEAGYYTKEIAEQENEYQSCMEPYYGTLKNGDTNYGTDWTQMGNITNIDLKTASSDYWLANRFIMAISQGGFFYVRNVQASGSLANIGRLCFVRFDDNIYGISQSIGFRPVFTLNSEIKVTEGENGVYMLVP